MSGVVVTLGGVPFQDFEVPEKIAFGGTQRVAVQNLIGGGRVVNALGSDDSEIAFSGIFSGDDASGRAQALDAARISGAAIPLVWGQFFYTVVVAGFAADYAKPWWIPFVVHCVVVTDPVADLVSLITPTTDAISNDISTATSLSTQAGVALADLGAGNIAVFTSAQETISSAISANGTSLTAGGNVLNGAADASTGTTAMNGISTSSSQLAALGVLNGYINRAAANTAGELP